MGFAFITLSRLLQPLLRVFGRRPPAAAGTCSHPHGLQTGASRAHVAWPQPDRTSQRSRPLRVLRVVDAAHAPSSAGRMVICGRLADVCAELDRLVALEATAA